MNKFSIEAQNASVRCNNMKNGINSGKGNLPKPAFFVLSLQAGLLQNMQQTVTFVESYHVYISAFALYLPDAFRHQVFCSYRLSDFYLTEHFYLKGEKLWNS